MWACAKCPYINLLVPQSWVSHTLVVTPIFLMESTFDEICLTPWLLTNKPRYLVSVCLKTVFFKFNFNHSSVSFYNTLSKAFKLIFNFCVVKTRTSTVTCIASKIPGRFWISCLRISRLLQIPIGSTWFSHFSTIVMGCLDPGYNFIWYDPGLPLVLTHAWPPVFFSIFCIFLCNLI